MSVKPRSTIHKGEFAELRVQFISLVKHPANRRPVIVKSGDGATFELPIRILRKDAATRTLYGVVYEPGLVDTQGDFASAEVIARAAHEFLRLGLVKMVDFQHDFDPGKGSVVESFILHGEDDRFPEVAKGAWVVAIELAPELENVLDEIGGLSLAGQGVYKHSDSTSIDNTTPPSSHEKHAHQQTEQRSPRARASSSRPLARRSGGIS